MYMYKTKIENEFYEELFKTDFCDYESTTQNAKTDSLCDNIDMTFEEWFDNLINVFVEETDYDKKTVVDSISEDFIKDMKEEFEFLVEEVQEILDNEDE